MRVDPDDAASLTERLQARLVAGLDVDLDRRTVLGGIGLAGAGALAASGSAAGDAGEHAGGGSTHGNFGAVGEYDGRFDPHEFMRTFNTGFEGQSGLTQRVFEREVERDGERTTERVREFDIAAVDTTVEIAPGVEFAAWAYENQVPGPTLRVTEGDVVRINFTNGSRHAHTIHPHLRNLDPAMDGIPQNGPGVLDEGESFTYEWQARPPGVHLYHCHSLPLKEHIHRGLYGTVIVDPDPERVLAKPEAYVPYHRSQITDELRADLYDRAVSLNNSDPRYADNEGMNGQVPDAQELVMVMNGFDTNFDGDNEVYAVNTRAFAYGVGSSTGKGEWEAGETIKPIEVERDRPVRVYLVNVIEFDAINSFHSHSQFFDYYDHGTSLVPTHRTVDTVMQCQAQRGIIELDYSNHQPGLYMFHAHQSEFAELGWMSFFDVQEGGT